MDQRIPAAEANRSFSRLLQEVRQGQSFIVTAHGKPVARLVPCKGPQQVRATAREALMARLAAQPPTGPIIWHRDELYER